MDKDAIKQLLFASHATITVVLLLASYYLEATQLIDLSSFMVLGFVMIALLWSNGVFVIVTARQRDP